ncbi:putative ubiquitinyl hydrolase 1 [Helianthus annuus]|nr:putative ubiquitinyl hydrolase 1 [Helianthus annuus]
MTLVTPQPLDVELVTGEDEEMLVPHSEILEGPLPVQGPVAFDGTPPVEAPQPMEVVASTVENQAIEEPQVSRFTWAIQNFSRQTNKKLYSDVFVVGGYKWRVLIFPKGNNVDHLSMYLDVADSSSLPYGWSRHAQFNLAVVNNSQQVHRKERYVQLFRSCRLVKQLIIVYLSQLIRLSIVFTDTQHQFHARESDWGSHPSCLLAIYTTQVEGIL